MSDSGVTLVKKSTNGGFGTIRIPFRSARITLGDQSADPGRAPERLPGQGSIPVRKPANGISQVNGAAVYGSPIASEPSASGRPVLLPRSNPKPVELTSAGPARANAEAPARANAEAPARANTEAPAKAGNTRLPVRMPRRSQGDEHVLKALLMSLPQRVFIKDPDGTYKICNERFAEDMNISREEVRGKTDHDLYPKALADKFSREDARILETREGESGEHTFFQDGAEVVIRWSKVPVTDESGNMTAIIGVITDVTQQIHFEKTMHKGYSFLKNSLKEKTNELTEIKDALKRALDEKKAARMNAKILQLAQETNGSDGLMQDAYNDLKRMLSEKGTDIKRLKDEVRAAEEEKEAYRRRMETFTTAMDNALWEYDIDNMSVSWNEGFAAQFGYDTSKVGTDLSWWEDHIHPDDRGRIMNSPQALMNNGKKESQSIYRFQRADGSFAHVLDQGLYCEAENGSSAKIIGSIRDISPLRMAEEQLRQNEGRLFTFLEGSPAGVLIINARTGKPYYLNETAMDLMTAEEAAETEDADIWDLLPAYVSGTWNRYPTEGLPHMRALQGQSVTVDDIELRRENEVISLSVTSVPIFGSDGKVDFTISYFTDTSGNTSASREAVLARARFNSLAGATGDWVWEVDRDGVIQFASDHVKDTLGYEPDQLQGKTALDLVTSEQRDAVSEGLLEALGQGGQVRDIEMPLQRSDGSSIRALTTWTPIRFALGGGVGYRVVGRDVTRLKLADDLLRQDEAVLAASLAGIAVMNLNGTVTYVNEALANMLGYADKSQIMGVDFTDLIGEGIRKKAGKRMKLLPKKGTWTEEVVMRREGMDDLHTSIAVSLICDPDGLPTGMCASVIDISELRDAQDRETHLAELVQNVSDSVIEVDPGGAITEWNDGAREMFGWTREEAVGMELFDMGLFNFAGTTPEKVMHRLVTDGHWEGEMTSRRKDGGEIKIFTSVSPRRSAMEGRGSGMVLISNTAEGESRCRRSCAPTPGGMAGLLIGAFPALMEDAPSKVRDRFLADVGTHFETAHKEELLAAAKEALRKAGKPGKKAEAERAVLSAYCAWAEATMSRLGFDVSVTGDDAEITFELTSCSYAEAGEETSMYCQLCGLFVNSSFGWTGLKRTIILRSACETGVELCHFSADWVLSSEEAGRKAGEAQGAAKAAGNGKKRRGKGGRSTTGKTRRGDDDE